MHGHNESRGHESSEKGYQVHDIFYTIQGEGPFSGMPAVFVRLTGCNLKCHWCDTIWDDDKDPYLTPEQIHERIFLAAPSCRLVVLTGGEPCRWDLDELIAQLKDYQVQVETAGTLWQQCLLEKNVTIVVSPKIRTVHPKFYQHAEHWKYVVTSGDADPKDGLPLESTQRGKEIIVLQGVDGTVTDFEKKGGPMARPPKDRKVTVYLQPCDEGHPVKNLANTAHMVQIALKHGYRAGVQLHKLFGVP